MLLSTTAQWQPVRSYRSLRGQRTEATVCIVHGHMCVFISRACDRACVCIQPSVPVYARASGGHVCAVIFSVFAASCFLISILSYTPSCHVRWWPPVCVADISGSLRTKTTLLCHPTGREKGEAAVIIVFSLLHKQSVPSFDRKPCWGFLLGRDKFNTQLWPFFGSAWDNQPAMISTKSDGNVSMATKTRRNDI